jgi:hypothetical protein
MRANVFVVPLPGDQMLSVASEAIRAVGIAFALVTGHLPWACASYQSLVHDKLIRETGKLIEKATAEYLNAATQAARVQTARKPAMDTEFGLAKDDPGPAPITLPRAKTAQPGDRLTATNRLRATEADSVNEPNKATEHPNAAGDAVGAT